MTANDQWWHFEQGSDLSGGDASSDACSSMEQARKIMANKPMDKMAYQYYAPAGRLYNKPAKRGDGTSAWQRGSMNLFMWGRSTGHTKDGKTLIACHGVDMCGGDGKISHNTTDYEHALRLVQMWGELDAAAFWHQPSKRLILKPKSNGGRWAAGDGVLFMWADKPLFGGGGGGAPPQASASSAPQMITVTGTQAHGGAYNDEVCASRTDGPLPAC